MSEVSAPCRLRYEYEARDPYTGDVWRHPMWGCKLFVRQNIASELAEGCKWTRFDLHRRMMDRKAAQLAANSMAEQGMRAVSLVEIRAVRLTVTDSIDSVVLSEEVREDWHPVEVRKPT